MCSRYSAGKKKLNHSLEVNYIMLCAKKKDSHGKSHITLVDLILQSWAHYRARANFTACSVLLSIAFGNAKGINMVPFQPNRFSKLTLGI
jgi:hypothetical protein